MQGVFARSPRITPTGVHDLDRILPDGGFTPGIVELSAPHALGGSTSVVLAFLRAAQAKKTEGGGWGAWVEPADGPLGQLYAPAVAQAGVDVNRLLVVRVSNREARGMGRRGSDKTLQRAALKLAASGGFDCVAVNSARFDETSVRKFSISAEKHGATVFLLTDSLAPHSAWPVTLRLELLRTAEGISMRVAKDKRGRAGASGTVALPFSTALSPVPAPAMAPVRLLAHG